MLITLRQFMKLESTSGILLVLAAVAAMVVANSPAAFVYEKLITLPVEVRVGPLQIAKPLLLWINDGLMVLFFFLVGLELKREFLVGELSRKGSTVFPAVGAVGGMLIPGLIYAWINWDDPTALNGWAIPAATDIAFALAILTLLGDRVPVALKVLLTSIAIFDDIGAIIIIALFYTSQLSMTALLVTLACLPVLYVLNRRGVVDTSRYVLIGAIMWIAMLKSGVHATLTGVLLAMFIPMKNPKDPEHSPLMDLEHDLHTSVAFGVLPLFAFVNAGIDLSGLTLEYVFHPVPLGIIAGLFVGKQVGIWSFCRLAEMLGIFRLPESLNWRMIYGVSLLCGVGFTMSLFIGSLAFEENGAGRMFDERLGIIIGSLLSGIAGYLVLRFVLPEERERTSDAPSRSDQ